MLLSPTESIHVRKRLISDKFKLVLVYNFSMRSEFYVKSKLSTKLQI